MKFLKIINWPITLCGLLLLSIGILVIYSSSKELALQQAAFAIFGIILYFFISLSDYRSIKKLIIPSYTLIISLLVIVSILGVETRGAVRWIPFGIFNIQPSEFAKPVLILLLAEFWSRNYISWKNILISIFWTLPIILLVFRQPDLGSSLMIFIIWFSVLFASGIKTKKIFLICFFVFIALPLIFFYLQDYQRQRIVGFLAPDADPLGIGYNLIQSQVAVGSGQLFGRGLGRGTQSRLQFLPEFRTDFIFAAIAEEMGFLGSLIILSLYFLLLLLCIRICMNAFDNFGFLIVFGVVSVILFQMFVNIGMNIGVLPITGITLPLISYGGSSLIATLISLGLVASIARLKKKIDPDDVVIDTARL